jgi:hypothetical protein
MKELIINTNLAISQISQIDNALTRLNKSRKNSLKASQICLNSPNKTVKIIIKTSSSQQRNTNIK